MSGGKRNLTFLKFEQERTLIGAIDVADGEYTKYLVRKTGRKYPSNEGYIGSSHNSESDARQHMKKR